MTLNVRFVPYVLYRTILHPTELKLKEFGVLEAGWHYGQGSAISEDAIAEAAALHRHLILNGFFKTDAFPGLSGEIQVAAYEGENYFVFERSEVGSWSFTHEYGGDEKECIENLNFDQAVEYIESLKSKLCNASDSFRYSIGTKLESGLTTLRSSPIEMMEEFPLSPQIA